MLRFKLGQRYSPGSGLAVCQAPQRGRLLCHISSSSEMLQAPFNGCISASLYDAR